LEAEAGASRGIPEDVRAFAHNYLCLRAVDNKLVTFDLTTVNCGPQLRCQILDREPRSAGKVMRMSRLDIVHSDSQMLA
jgi:hypothetical protein